jgi:hypothetical protein
MTSPSESAAETTITIRQPQAPQVSLLYPVQGGRFRVGKKIFYLVEVWKKE